MKKVVSVLVLIVVLLCSVISFAGCGEDVKSSKGLQYKKYAGDTTYTVFGFEGSFTAEDKKLDIKALVNNDEIVIGAIEDECFKGLAGVEEIIVPDTVTKIGKEAFAEMPDLKKLKVPFIGLSAKADAVINDTASSEDKAVDVERTMYYWFGTKRFDNGYENASKVNLKDTDTKYYLPVGLKTIELNPKDDYVIPAFACYNNLALKSLIVNAKVKGFGEYSFASCTHLELVKIGDADAGSQIDESLVNEKAFDGTKITVVA